MRGADVALHDDAETYEELHPKYGETPPLLAIEVLSPNDRAGQVLSKINDYLKAGVKLVWLVDPELRRVTVYRPGQPHVTLKGDEALTGDPALPAYRVQVKSLFRLPKEKQPTPQSE